MDHATATLNQVLPILLLIVLGHQMRSRGWFRESHMEGLKWLVINVALPSVLFLSFLSLELKVSYLAVMVMMFVLCIALYGAGVIIQRVFSIDHPYFPLLITGFEFGMLGVSLFGATYGLEQIGYIAVIGLGHEFFIWFPFLSLLLIRRDGIRDVTTLATAFLKAPPIIAIICGIALNLLGLNAGLHAWPVTGGILATLKFAGNMIIPLILVIVGFGFKLDAHGIKDVLVAVGVRMAILIPTALILGRVVLHGMLGLERGFEAGLFVMLILPPPFIIPLFMKAEDREERRYVNNVLTVNTAFSLLAFGIYLAFNPGL
jgi:hypothetical protein